MSLLAPRPLPAGPGAVTASAKDTWDARPWRGFGTSLAWSDLALPSPSEH